MLIVMFVLWDFGNGNVGNVANGQCFYRWYNGNCNVGIPIIIVMEIMVIIMFVLWVL